MKRRDFLLKAIGVGVGLGVAAAVDPLPEADAEVKLPDIEVEAVPFKMLTGLDTYKEKGVWQYRIRRPQLPMVQQGIGAVYRPQV